MSLKVPAMHGKHMSLVVPPLKGCTVPAGQAMHVPLDVAPVEDE